MVGFIFSEVKSSSLSRGEVGGEVIGTAERAAQIQICLPHFLRSQIAVAQKASVVVRFQPVIEVNLVEIRCHNFRA